MRSASPSGMLVQPGFDWRSADAYLFDIDGTLLNTFDGVHYRAFSSAFHDVWGIHETIDGVQWHGNTDIGIIRAVAERAGVDEASLRLDELCRSMSDALTHTRHDLRPQPCPAIQALLEDLRRADRLLGVATGNIEAVAWAKLENCGLREYFSLGSFSGPGRETRTEIFASGIEQIRGMLGGSARIHIVGDTPSDILSAREVGMPVIAVATGKYSFTDLEQLAPDMLLHCFNDLDLGQ